MITQARLRKIENLLGPDENPEGIFERDRAAKIARCRLLLQLAVEDGDNARIQELEEAIKDIEDRIFDGERQPTYGPGAVGFDQRAKVTRERLIRELKPEVNEYE